MSNTETCYTLTIRVKDDDSTYKKEYLVYDRTVVSQDDPQIAKRIAEVLQEFGRPAEKIEVKIKLEVIMNQKDISHE